MESWFGTGGNPQSALSGLPAEPGRGVLIEELDRCGAELEKVRQERDALQRRAREAEAEIAAAHEAMAVIAGPRYPLPEICAELVQENGRLRSGTPVPQVQHERIIANRDLWVNRHTEVHDDLAHAETKLSRAIHALGIIATAEWGAGEGASDCAGEALRDLDS